MNQIRPLVLNSFVTIGELSIDHAPAMFRWMCDPEVSKNLGLRRSPTFEYTTDWINHARSADDLHVYTILFKNTHVGNIVLDRIDTYLQTARLSIYIGDPAYRSQGIGLSGMYLALRHGFSELSLHKVWLTVHVHNLRAVNLYHRLGFEIEGTLRDEFILDGNWVDVHYMGLLKSEFERLTI